MGCRRSAALLFSRGASVGAFDDATAILSRRLWPGTPSNVLAAPCFVLSPSGSDFLLSTGVGRGWPNLNDAALVILGAIVGAAVDATAIVLARL